MLQIENIFQNGMILQRNKPIIIWGTDTPGTEILAEIQGKAGRAVTDPIGNWNIRIPALAASEQETLVIRSGNTTVTYTDVAVGEVWVAGGQSNMEFWMRYEKHKSDALNDCPDKRIRFYDVPEVCYPGQREEFDYSRQAVWRQATVADLEYFSAVGYYFQKEIEKALNVPVGIIGCNWGGTLSCAWMEPETVRAVGEPWMRDYEKKTSAMDMKDYWKAQHCNPMNDRGNPFADPFGEFVLPKTPTQEELQAFFGQMSEEFDKFSNGLQPQQIPGSLYEYMLKTIAPYSIRGFLWYQGESDDVKGRNILYKDMLTGLIADWRRLWGEEELPFILVQLPGFRKWLDGEGTNQFPIIRKCQELVAESVKNTYLCSISDSGEEYDIHPKNKKVVGERMALLARGHVYGEDILCDAPRAKEIRRAGGMLTIYFDHAEGGLRIIDGDLTALKIYSGDCEAEYKAWTEGNQIIIELKDYKEKKIKIEFAQTPWFQVNLYNQAGIPALPFEFEC